MSRLEQLLIRYKSLQVPISLKHVEDCLRQERFNGAVTFHYRDGVPRRIEAGRPITLELTGEVDGGFSEGLDKR